MKPPLERLIVGLGNPGPLYEAHRHNVGFMAVRALAERHGALVPVSRYDGLFSTLDLFSCRVGLLAPLTFMNHSGTAVAGVLDDHPGLASSDLMIVSDDLDLPLSRIRMRAGGGPGGQNGLADVLEALGTEAVPRLRLGIGRPAPGVDPRDHVLSEFGADELEPLRDVVDRSVTALAKWVECGLDRAMEAANRPPESAGD